MVGLGDLVIPGLFISICLKFDVDRFFDKFTAKRVSEMKFTYFRLAFVGYIVGIILTFIVMIIFEAAQPALLYLVPTVSLSVLGLACRNGEIEEAKEYTTGLKKPEVSS